ncbi:putative NADPH-quinone reductase [Rhizobium azooxidifex]|uniref:Putative NADPH-quinone reductase n=1 Tax=Mycoplana azooxidifex TaxID=1636188 RepID=A0A7W6DBK6_9HYPH|nr:NAD(P)H-dependent oxidoreductase [Mycoplana azooxidifex]MBB3979539.1 putative NADPH-quinone reductase [Mycoplana azooxidifex]
MRVLVLFAHPAQRKSSVNVAMASGARQLGGVTFVDLYAEYPRFSIDVDREQRRLMQHDVIVFQFPLFWYSTPALLKQWQDLVLEYGFAYGPKGKTLSEKYAIACITTGGSKSDYSEEGGNRREIRNFLYPLEQTAGLCGMEYLPPFVLHSANHIDDTGAQLHIRAYPQLLAALRDDRFDLAALRQRPTFDSFDLTDLVRN